jgi:hypothetical protein
MVTTDKLFAGSIPGIYDQFLVPLIFESYAHDLAERVAKVTPQDVLETAARPAPLPDKSHPCFRHTRALWRPISISRCSIVPLRNNLAIIG